MTKKEKNAFEDFSKLFGSAMDTAFSSFNDGKKYLDSMVKERLERLLHDLHLVTREEFEVVRAMAEKAREENAALAKKIKALEKKGK